MKYTAISHKYKIFKDLLNYFIYILPIILLSLNNLILIHMIWYVDVAKCYI